MKNDALSLSLVASFLIHGVAIILASVIVQHTVRLRQQDFLRISLVDVPRNEQQPRKVTLP